jgi:hypothetical protein
MGIDPSVLAIVVGKIEGLHSDKSSILVDFPMISYHFRIMFRPDLCGPSPIPQINAVLSLKLIFKKLSPR